MRSFKNNSRRRTKKDLAARVIAAAVAEETAALRSEIGLLKEELKRRDQAMSQIVAIINGIGVSTLVQVPRPKLALPTALAAQVSAADEEAAMLADPRNDALASGDDMGPGRWV